MTDSTTLNLTITRTGTDQTAQKSEVTGLTPTVNYTTTTTVSATNWDELSRMLELAGVKMDDQPTMRQAAIAVNNDGEVEIQDGEVEIVDAGSSCSGGNSCACANGCSAGCGCGCDADTQTNEGWLEHQIGTGAVEFEVCGPDDMIDIQFDTSTGGTKVNETAQADYGHNHYKSRVSDIKAYDYKGRPESGRNALRITNNMADNPMVMDEEAPIESEYDTNINAVCELVKSDIDANDFTTVRDYVNAVDGEGRDARQIEQDIRDQFLVLFDQTAEEMGGRSVIEGTERLKESIGILVENTSDEFMTALDKIKENRANRLTDNEVSHLAAAFINMMRQSSLSKMQRLGECMYDFINGDMEDEFAKFINENDA